MSRIEHHLILHIVREITAQIHHLRFHSFCHIERIRPRQLINGDSRRFFTVNSRCRIVSRTSQIYGSDVAQPQIFPAGQRLDDDPSELLRRRKATFRNQCKLESLVRIRRRLSHTTGRHLHILCLNSRIDIGRRKAPYTHQLRVEPDTHAVIIGSEHRHTAYSRQTGQLVGNVQLGIIRQI